MPVQAGVPLDQLDDTMESEPYVPLLPHQVQSVPYNVGSAVLDEYMGPYDPTFDCIVKGEPEPDIYWLRDGAQIPESTEAIMEYEDDDTCTLVLPAINLHKAGKYTCKAINPHGEATCSAVLTVKTDRRLQGMDGPQVADGTSYSPSQAKPPKFLEAPKDKTAEEGKQCRVSCEIDGIPPPAVTWSKDGDQLSDEACRFEQEGQTYTLILDETVLDDEGFYACTAVNPKGRAEKMFQIKVKEAGEAPTFVGPLIDTTADDGTCVQLKCKVQGARPMKILWRKYDIHLTPSSMYHMSYNESTGDCMLEIVIVGRNDEGEFLCRAENEFGREETTAELIVEGPEPVPYAPKVTAPLKDVEVLRVNPGNSNAALQHTHDPS
ncbi:putative muscle M-line assembly protein unc-89 [Apostichopus japonicus]|uniref:Putative muscle M-line assembly protein unc-89 n=1 Tax=Stichopus japonicus TaxID=307972 RepID=A0A2G8LL11_STIJA|nr:putative muscle M-line assembly protein unc-89 [Apostichopus japonicus]